MNGNNLEPEFPVVKDEDILSECPFANSRYVNPRNVDEEVENGGFLRIYCEHDGRWCDAEFGSDYCAICTDHLNE